MTQTQAISQNIRTTIDSLPDDPDALRDEPDPGQVVQLLCRQKVTVRPARPQDTGIIQAYIRGLSPASRRNRFLGSLNEVSANELYRMTHTDRCSHAALIAENVVEGECTMIGEARYAVVPDGFHCELAVSVDDTWRRKTLGTLLVGIVAYQARALGLRYLIGEVFRWNEAMIALARKTRFALSGPVADARLVRVTKDLSLLDALQPWNETCFTVLADRSRQTQMMEAKMTNLTVRTLEGPTKSIPQDTVTALRGKLRGTVVLPGEDGYDTARSIWNAMIDRRPGLVVRCLGAADVINAIKLARDERLLVAVRSGGHNIAGNAVCDGGFLIDLSLMRSVRVDPASRMARVEPGATLADFDKEAQGFGLATPLGINSTTGVAGLTLGGGFGWTTRKFGLTVDNLISADVITADAKLVRASENENQDLFWALRGGGGNFGVVTSFEFNLHPLGPEVLSGLVVHPLEKAGELLPEFRRIAKEAPDELTTWVVMRKAPPLPFLPTEWHGKEVLIFAACYSGDIKQGEKATKALRALGKPIADVISPHPFTGWQAAFDPLLTPGARNYWKSHDFTDLSDPAIKVILDAVRTLPSPECEVFIAHVGGAMARVAADATAWPNRDAHFIMNVHTRWRDKAQDSACVAWTRQLFEAAAPFASGSVYVNFMPDDESDRVEKAYGANYRRLAEIKHRYDPDNLFRMNQNIRPTSRLLPEKRGQHGLRSATGH